MQKLLLIFVEGFVFMGNAIFYLAIGRYYIGNYGLFETKKTTLDVEDAILVQSMI